MTNEQYESLIHKALLSSPRLMDYCSDKLFEAKQSMVKVDFEKISAALLQLYGMAYDTAAPYISVKFKYEGLDEGDYFSASFYFCGEKFFEIIEGITVEGITVEGRGQVTLCHKYRILGHYELG